MEKLYGLWVDHGKAIIVSLIDGSHQVIHVESDIEGHFRLKDDSQPINPSNLQGNTIESKMDSRYRKYLKIYFQHIIDVLKEAKASDKLTEPQIIAKVKKYFNKK